MDELKAKWQQWDQTTRVAVGFAGAVIAILFVAKILPALAAGVGVGLFIVLIFVPYLTPSIVAGVRKHPSKAGIVIFNFFLGWTFVGWVVALAWALSDSSARTQTVIVNTTVSAHTGAHAAPPPPPPASYNIGDVVNGRRFDGQGWVQVHSAPPQPALATESEDEPSDAPHPTAP